MKIVDIKKKMIDWRDFFGQDMGFESEIEKAKTRKQLLNILDRHIHFLEMQNIDAPTDAEDFKKELGLADVF
jgi:hypothetical protein